MRVGRYTLIPQRTGGYQNYLEDVSNIPSIQWYILFENEAAWAKLKEKMMFTTI